MLNLSLSSFCLVETSVPARILPKMFDDKEVSAMEQPVSEKSVDTSSNRALTPVDPAAERKLLLKIDLALMPILFLLFLVSFMDRTNIANAKIEGLEKSLNMKSNQYNIAVFIFNIPYVLLDIPSNLIMQKVKPSWWLGGMMFCWGRSICRIHPCTTAKALPNRCLVSRPGSHEDLWRSPRLPRAHWHL